MVQKIISGGQTGVDRAALDWAIAKGIPHGGWCPAGRIAEDGAIPERYHLCETPTRRYPQRTRWNVRDSDATLIISSSTELTGGSLATKGWATRINRPYLHVYPSYGWRDSLHEFLKTHPIQVLNVAGPRRSASTNLECFVYEVLDEISTHCER
jgi:hypothetical protein